MAGRADQAESLGVFAADHPLDGVAHGAGRLEGNVVAGRADDRVGFDVAAARFGEGPNLVDIGRGMHAREMLSGDRIELRLATPRGQARLPQTFWNSPDAIGPLGVVPRFVVEKAGRQSTRVSWDGPPIPVFTLANAWTGEQRAEAVQLDTPPLALVAYSCISVFCLDQAAQSQICLW